MTILKEKKLWLFLAIILTCLGLVSLLFKPSKTTSASIIIGDGDIYKQVVTPAYNAIKTGKFPARMVNSPTWKKYSQNGKTITIAGYEIGNGITHTDTESETIITELYSNRELFDSLSSKEKESDKRRLSRTKEGTIPLAFSDFAVVIISQGSKVLAIEKGEQESVIFHPKSIAITYPTLGSHEQTEDGTYVIENNQAVPITFTVPKEMLQEESQTLDILMPLNLRIEGEGFTELERAPVTKTLSELGVPDLTSSNYDDRHNAILTNLTNELMETAPSRHYTYILGKSDTDVTITAACVKEAVVEQDVVVNVGGDIGQRLEKIPVTMIQAGKDQDFQPISLTMQASVQKNGIRYSTKAPNLTSAGINFVMVRGENDRLAKGMDYRLGKIVDGKPLFATNNGWKSREDIVAEQQAQQTAMEAAEQAPVPAVSEEITLRGGEVYDLRNPQVMAYDLRAGNWASDQSHKRSEKLQSLIGIRGLGQGQRYFVQPVTLAPNRSEESQRQYFTVIGKNRDKKQDNFVIKDSVNSIGHANIQTSRNGEIPIYQGGISEFNRLSITYTEKPTDWAMIMAYTCITALVALIVFIGYWLIKHD